MPNKSYLIACGVLRPDVASVLEQSGTEVDIAYLEGGLHSDPPELRRRVQAAIDAAVGRGYEFIILGYGMCGRGTIGLQARDTPLLIPKVHDCIALFLGSDRTYREEFRKFPGTYYISAGWYREKVQPKGTKCDSAPRDVDHRQRRELAAKYGDENAEAIVEFLTSWRRNYQRAAFIDTGVSAKGRYDSYAQAMAEEFGWVYERLEGTHELLEKLFDLQKRHEEIIVIPPGHVTVYDAKRQGIAAGWKANEASKPAVSAPSASSAPSGAGREAAAASSRFGASASGRSAKQAAHRPAQGGGESHYGLGIDAGGTYTDAVIFDFARRTVLCKGKALTTKWDYSVGIMNAVDQLDAELFPHIELTAISTTLATNAIVEGKGQTVGLILIPSDFHDPSEIVHEPTAVVQGRMNISGQELEPVDPEQVRQVVREMLAQGVRAFAVSGYAASINPSHELAVKQIIQEESGLATCLGSELSELLNFFVRANTAVLNAKILPLLASFMDDVARSLTSRQIAAPIMVVRGDGSLMTDRFAAEHPVETVMSGPAASVAGARYLTAFTDALVVDVGGTTSDVGRIAAESVQVNDAGSRVGRWRTHVRAVDMKTEGIGGDSEIVYEKRILTVGPRRVEPASLLATEADLGPAIDFLATHVDDFETSTRPMTMLSVTRRAPRFELTEAETHVYNLLQERPYSIKELTIATGVGHPSLLRTTRLIDDYCIQTSALTPTDLLHVRGVLSLWDREIAVRLAAIYAEILGVSVNNLYEAAFAEIRRGLVTALLEKQFEMNADVAGLGRRMIENIVAGGGPDIEISVRLPYPLVGLGAAAPFLLADTAKIFQTDLEIPPHAEVANAVGAITSLVSVKKSVSIVASDIGTYHVHGLPGAPEHSSLDEAYEFAVESLRSHVLTLARAAGTEEEDVKIELDDVMSESADGAAVFIERRVVASVTGQPGLR